MPPKTLLPPRSVEGELRAYGREVRAWSTGLVTRYVAAVSFLLAAFGGLIGAEFRPPRRPFVGLRRD
jgi:hypothetical protein